MKIALLHRHTKDQIKATNAAYPYLVQAGIEPFTFKKFNRVGGKVKFLKSLVWIFYSPFLLWGKKYDTIYCDDSFPFYSALVKLMNPFARVIKRMGDFHLMYYTSGWAYKILHHFEKLEWKTIDGIIAISEPMADLIEKEIGVRPTVILDPVDPKDFEVETVVPVKRRVMFHGVLTKNKNVDILLDAARMLSDIEFVIIGNGPDYKRLKSIAPKNVKFLGWIPFKNIKNYIQSCSLGVALRSNNPGNEYVVTSPFLQYSAMGKLCLVTDRKVFEKYPYTFRTSSFLVALIYTMIDKPEEGEIMKEAVIAHHNAPKIAKEIMACLKQQ